MSECVILGAGVAGLSAANALIDMGAKATLVEAAKKPSVKTCGEFLSHESLPLLEGWEIFPDIQLKRTNVYCRSSKGNFHFALSCASMPRLELEEKLLARFLQKGGKAKFGYKVEKILPAPHFQLNLENGEIIEAEQLVVSTGRWQNAIFKPRFMGVKNHFYLSKPLSELNMIFFDGGYLGVSPINSSKAVVSCLIKYSEYEKKTADKILNKLSKIEELKNCLAEPVYRGWLTAPIGSFGCKTLPMWPNSYFIGDAAGTIAPLFGEGMTMALHSGKMTADFITQGKWQEYRKAWNARYRKRIKHSKILNQMAFSPLAPLCFPLLKRFPQLASMVFKK